MGIFVFFVCAHPTQNPLIEHIYLDATLRREWSKHFKFTIDKPFLYKKQTRAFVHEFCSAKNVKANRIQELHNQQQHARSRYC